MCQKAHSCDPNQAVLSCDKSVYKRREMDKYIIMHWTQNSDARAKNTDNKAEKNNGQQNYISKGSDQLVSQAQLQHINML